MSGIRDLNLIRFFDFYLATCFALSTLLRLRQYHAVLGLVRSVPERWPRLFRLVTGHGSVFLTWRTVAPGALALTLMAIQFVASRVLWPQAAEPPFGLTVERLLETGWFLAIVAPLGLCMVGFDGYSMTQLGQIDRRQLEPYFDQAEYWLRSWAAPVLKAFTFGKINPRQMVSTEVRTALLQVSELLNWTLWWVSLQLGLRLGYGTCLWLAYAMTRDSALPAQIPG